MCQIEGLQRESFKSESGLGELPPFAVLLTQCVLFRFWSYEPEQVS